MRPQLILVSVILFATCNVSIAQSVVYWLDLENRIVLEPLGDRAVDLAGIDIKSDAGVLIPGGSPKPFFFDLVDPTPENAVFGTLGVGARIDGTTLELGFDLPSSREMQVTPCDDLSIGVSGGAFVTCPIPGDADFSGTVDFADFLVLSANFGQSEAVWPTGDFDWDRTAGFTDFLVLSANYGADSSGSVPQTEPISVRPSTAEEIAFVGGQFVSPELSAFDGAPAYWIHDGRLWAREVDANYVSASLSDTDSVTIVAPHIDDGKAIQFGAQLKQEGRDLELVSVRLQTATQDLAFTVPDSFEKSLVLPIGVLERGEYEIEITRYELTVNHGFTGIDVATFLADPEGFEMPDGPLVTVSQGTLEFEVGASNVTSVPEPKSSLFSIGSAFAFGLAFRRRIRSQRRRQGDTSK